MPPADGVTSRFIGKVAIEALAHRCQSIPGSNKELVEHTGLGDLRNYVRLGDKNVLWPVHIRPLYAADALFADQKDCAFQVLNEWTFHGPNGEIYAVVAIFGIEYSINLGGPVLGGFLEWLSRNNGGSPLYLTNR
jgi:hypothetical protein